VSTSDRAVGRETFTDGLYDRDQLRRVLDVVGDLRPGATIVEVGANIGTTTLLLARELRPRRLVAFEPDPLNAALLRCNVVANGLSDVVVVRETAVSDQAGTADLETSPDNHGDHRVRVVGGNDGPEALAESQRRTVSVPVTTLDAALSAEGIDPAELALVWSDVQGHEAQMLTGASGLLGAAVPVVIEYWPYGLRRAGGLERLEALIAGHYREIVEVGRSGAPRRLAAAEIGVLRERYGAADEYADLVLLR
jgi:FkbM family methyltransferase